MNLYVDDDLANPMLARLLQNAGHDVQLPTDVGLSGSHDAAHLRYAIREQRVCLSGNHHDFQFLHALVLEAQGHHFGILIVRRDNDPKRDLTPRGIVRAIGKRRTANFPLADQFQILNHWR